jgi:hypothetical protein
VPFRISWGVYIRVAILAMATEVLILNRSIRVVYHYCKSDAVLRRSFFSSSVSSIEYHIKAEPRRHAGIRFLTAA